MTAAAEAAGKLEEVYDQLADTYQQELELRRKIAAVAACPVLVLSLALVGAVVVQQASCASPLEELLLAYSGASLPLLTKMLLLLGQPSTWHVLLVLLRSINSTILDIVADTIRDPNPQFDVAAHPGARIFDSAFSFSPYLPCP